MLGWKIALTFKKEMLYPAYIMSHDLHMRADMSWQLHILQHMIANWDSIGTLLSWVQIKYNLEDEQRLSNHYLEKEGGGNREGETGQTFKGADCRAWRPAWSLDFLGP